MEQKLTFIFSITTEDENKVEKAARELSRFFNAKQSSFDTVVISNLGSSQVSELVDELFDEDARSSDLDVIFDHFGITVKGVRIDNIETLKNKMMYDHKEEFEESKKVNRKSIRETSEKRAYLKGLKEHTVPFTELNDFTKEMIEEAAKDDYSMNHKNSAADLIEWIYGDDDVSPELARKAYDYYCDVYSELQSHSEDDDYFDDEQEETVNNDSNRWDIPRFYDESKKSSKNKKSMKEGNRVGNNEFVPDYIDQFLEDVAQYSELFDYSDIIAFERDVFAPNDKNVKALKNLYRQAKEAIEANDEEDMNRIYQDVADLVTGVVDYEA